MKTLYLRWFWVLPLWASLCVGAWALGRFRGETKPEPHGQTTLAVSDQAASVTAHSPHSWAELSPEAQPPGLEAAAAYEKLRQPESCPVPGVVGQIIGEGQLIESLLAMPRQEIEKLVALVLKDAKSLDGGRLGVLVQQVLAVKHADLAFDVIRFLNDHPGSASYIAHMGVAFDVLATHDPQAALAQWEKAKAQAPPPEWLESKLLSAVFSAWQRRDVAGALEAAEALPGLFDGPKETWTLEADRLGHRLLAEADQRYIGILKNLAANRISAEAPEETLAWLASAGVAPGVNERLDQAIAQGWAEAVLRQQDSPAPAWDWLLEHTPAENRAAVMAAAMRYWCRSDQFHIPVFPENGKTPPDLAECSEWLIARGLGPESQEAMALLAQAWGQQYEPEAALAWARAIPGEAARQAAEERVMEELRKRFPTGWAPMPDEAAPK